MKYIKTFNELITEKKVAYKRQYTEDYPAKVTSTSARVRNAIFDAMKDGVITEDEMKNILEEVAAHRRWLSRNKDLFKLEEDAEGRKTYKLSKKGRRIFKSVRVVNESLNIPIDKWEETLIDGDMGTVLVATKYNGKYYSAYASFGPRDEIVELDDIREVSKKEYESYFKK